MYADELREKTEEELNDHLVDLRKEQLQLRIQKSMGQLNQTHRLREVSREVARVKTVLNESASASS